MIAMRSQSRSASSMSCVVSSTVVPLLAQVQDRLPQEEARLGVEARGGLVQHQQARLVHQRAGQHQALGHAAGVVVDLVVLAPGQAEPRHELQGALAPLAAAGPEVRGVEGQVLQRGERAVQVAALRHDGDARLDRDRVAHDVDAVHQHAPRGRPHAGGDDPDGRGLAGPVRAEQAEHLGRPHGEVDARHGLGPVRSVALVQALHPQHVRRARPLGRRAGGRRAGGGQGHRDTVAAATRPSPG